MNYAAIYKFTVQSFLLIIHKTEITGEKNTLKQIFIRQYRRRVLPRAKPLALGSG